MIESQRQLGSLLLENTTPVDFLHYITENVEEKRQGKEHYILILNLNTAENRLEIDNKRIGKTTADSFVWIGTADGAASPQWYFTTNNVEYLVSQTIPNILKLLSKNSNLYKRLNFVFNNYFYDLGPQKGMKNRYRYMLDLEKLGIPEIRMEQIIKENEGDVKKVVKVVGKLLADHVKSELGISASQISLWNLKVDGMDVVKQDEYVKLVINEKIDKLYTGEVGVCSLCGEQKNITDNTTRLQFKYYMTDKIGFSSNLSGSFLKNMRLCKDCYRQVLAGESYIKQNLGFFIGGLRVYLVPAFIFTPDRKVVSRNYDGFKNIKDSLLNINDFIKKEKRLKLFSKQDQGNSFILNLLFYEKKQAEFKILKLIKDVSPSRFMHLAEVSMRVKQMFEKYLGESGMWGIDFNRIYYMIPLRVKGGSPVEYRKLLNLYDNILSDKPVDREFLINQFVKMAHIHHLENYRPYNFKKSPDNSRIAMAYGILQNIVFLKYLESLGLLKGGQGMNVDDLIIADDIKEYIRDLKFDESRTALFLLGYLIGEVAGAQKESNPVLNKINYQGMSKAKLQHLISEIFEKLKQYKVLNYNRKEFSDMKRLFDRQLDNWNLSAQDNVFYILSGYAYQVRRVNLKSKEKKAKEGAIVNE